VCGVVPITLLLQSTPIAARSPPPHDQQSIEKVPESGRMVVPGALQVVVGCGSMYLTVALVQSSQPKVAQCTS